MRNYIAALALVALATPVLAQVPAPTTIPANAEKDRKDRTKPQVEACLTSYGFVVNDHWVNVRSNGTNWEVDRRPDLGANPVYQAARGLCLHGKPL